jgi:competence ComEA-like helix-hairpin-helix protein
MQRPLHARRERALAAALLAIGLAALLRSGAGIAAPPRPSAPGPERIRLDPDRATAAELGLLPGLGPARVQALLEQRERVGSFRSLAELAEVPGLGPKSLDRLRGHLDFGGRDASPRERP